MAYTREDALFAIRIMEDLRALGVDVWLDLNEIGPDIDWITAQQAAIEASEGLIVILSPEAMKRDHMRTEIEQAFLTGKQVYLAVARRSPWREWLKGLPVADFTQQYEAGLDRLLLNIMGDSREANAENDDEAARWLREQAGHPAKTDEALDSEEPKSLLSRLLRR